MIREKGLAFCLLSLVWIAAQAQPQIAPQRGELLYATHCHECHTAQVHWREKRQATDWPSLTREVRHWSDNAHVSWSEDDWNAVARHLNAIYYRFPSPDDEAAAPIRRRP